MRILAIGDSDSYIKWGAALLSRAPLEWNCDLAVVLSPVAPSTAQLTTALQGTRFAVHDVAVLDLDSLARKVVAERYDAVLLAVRGPMVRVMIRAITSQPGRRPVLISGLPGITIPAAAKAVTYRAQTDLVILHSHREVREFTALATAAGDEQSFGLATLPFLVSSDPGARADTLDGPIVFAAQAKVPRYVEDRVDLLGWLAQSARNHPDRQVTIKVRARAGEAQTHLEEWPLDRLLDGLPDRPDNLVVRDGHMTDHLLTAGALVTVSSTAAIEAIALNVPALVLDDFGITDEMINPVFIGSGMIGSSADLIAGHFHRADPGWRRDNYLHDESENTWVSEVERLLARREAGPFPLRPQRHGRRGGGLRQAWDRKRELGPFDRSVGGYAAMAIGAPSRWAIRRARRLRWRIANPDGVPERRIDRRG